MDKLRKDWILLFFVSCGLAVLYVISQVHFANKKPLWVDEAYGLTSSVRSTPLQKLIVNGGAGQGSPAPLDYVCLKFWDAIKSHVHYFGLTPLSYFRLNSILSFLLTGLIAVFLMGRASFDRSSYSVVILSILVMATYWFNGTNFYYGAEMRPYALWASLWFLSLTLFLFYPDKSLLLSVGLSLLALTATASIFQLFILFLAHSIVLLVQKVDGRRAVLQQIKTFTVPVIVSLYYCTKAGTHHGYTSAEWGTWTVFLSFWKGQLYNLFLSAAVVVLCFLNKKTRHYSFPSMVLVGMFLISPLIYYVTRSRGFFFSNRQYIFFEATEPIFWMTIFLLLRDRWNDIRSQKLKSLVLVGLISVAFVNYSMSIRKGVRWAKQGLSQRYPDFIMDKNRILESHPSGGAPRAFCLEASHGVSGDDRVTIGLFAEWMKSRYGNFPQTDSVIRLVHQEKHYVVDGIQSTPCQGVKIAIGP